MHRVVILADDLSGAADCAVTCVRGGLNAVVSLSPTDEHPEADVLAFDADTRSMTSSAASERIYQLTCSHASDPALVLFKKIDSTLRGHLAPELAAMLRARRRTVPDAIAIMAPAFPAAGRTTRDGTHFLHGVPLHESDMWRREAISGEAHIPTLLAGSGLRCTPIDLQTLRGEATALLQSSIPGSTDIVLCDAETSADLALIAKAAASLRDRALWVGSAGLAQHLVQACSLYPLTGSSKPRLPAPDGPVLFVIGSTSRNSRQQVSELLAVSTIHSITVPAQTLLAGPPSADWTTFSTKLQSEVERGHDVVFQCASEPEIAPHLRLALSRALGEMTSVLHGHIGALVASGGETARSVLERWGVRSFELHGELENGVPISSARPQQSRALTIITKAGDFGQPSTLLHCHQWLTQARKSR